MPQNPCTPATPWTRIGGMGASAPERECTARMDAHSPRSREGLVGAEIRADYNFSMPVHEPGDQSELSRRVLAGLFVVGAVLALLAGAFAPALSGSALMVRVVAGVVGMGCVAGLVLLGRPRASAGAPGARPICPQCGFDLTTIPAEESGRTTCPGCEMTWAFGRDRAVWREDAPPARAVSPQADADAPIPFPGTSTPERAKRRAQRRAMNRWLAILIVYLLVVGAGSYALTFGLGMGSAGQVILVNALAFGAGPLVFAVASVVAFFRAGRG